MINADEPLRSRYPIVIAGGGSVGLCLAAELGWRGVPCLVVEERDMLNDHPRANAVANRTMEYFRRWGIDEAVTNAGIPPSSPAEYLWVSTLDGSEIHRLSLPPYDELVATQKTGDYASEEHSWSPYLKTITGQNEVEAAVLDYVSRLQEVDYRFSWRLLEFEDDGNGLTCMVEQVATGRREQVDASFLVGCDGGRSLVRRQLGVTLEGRADLASFVSIYFRAPGMIDAHGLGHGNIFFPLHRDHRGFILTWDDDKTYTYHLVLDEGQNWASVDPVEAVRAVVGAAIDVEVHSVQPWTAHALVASEYRKGRVFLAGDAAHLFSPTGGFGMNTGISDAVDLAWKLKADLEGWAGPRMLNSYGDERRPIGVRNTTEAADCFDRLFAVMQNGDELDEESDAADVLRANLKADLKDQEKLISSSGTLLGYRYDGSGLVVPDSTPAPPDDPRCYTPVARPGHRAPHVWLESGEAIYDLLGPDFNLLILAGTSHDVDPIVAAAAALGLPLQVTEISEPAVRDVYQADLVMIRPDLMVAWRGHHPPSDPAALIDTIRGA